MTLHPLAVRSATDVATSLENSLKGIRGVTNLTVTTEDRTITVCAQVGSAGQEDFAAAMAEYRQTGFLITHDKRHR
jgi:hypothetical protein